MPKDTASDEDNAARKKFFKPTSKVASEQNGAESTIYEKALQRKKSKENKSLDYEPPRRVSDLLKSLSKFDDDIARLRGVDSTDFKSTDALIDALSIDEMEKELKTFLFNRDKIKSDLDALVMNVTQTSYDLEQEEEKIKKIKIKIQKEKEIGVQGD